MTDVTDPRIAAAEHAWAFTPYDEMAEKAWPNAIAAADAVDPVRARLAAVERAIMPFRQTDSGLDELIEAIDRALLGANPCCPGSDAV